VLSRLGRIATCDIDLPPSTFAVALEEFPGVIGKVDILIGLAKPLPKKSWPETASATSFNSSLT
jgi:hypothetical protein